MKEWESRSAQALTSFNNLLNCTHIHVPIPNLFPHCFVVHFEICYLFSVFPGTPDAQTAAAKWLRGIRWKAILFAISWRNIFSILTSRFSALCLWLNACHLRLCWHGRARIHPNIDVSKNAICTICRGWMAAGYQIKGNIVLYLLTKYCSIFMSRFSVICLLINSCHMGMCWHDCARIHPNIDVYKNAIYPICRGWMAAGYQMKSNIVFYQLTTYFSNITSRFSAMWVSI